MGITTYKPLILYCTALVVLGIASSLFESVVLMRSCIAAYLIGWALFLWFLWDRKP
jgi:hypothetical protein